MIYHARDHWVRLLYFGPVVSVMNSHLGGRGSTPLGGNFHTAEFIDEILLEIVSQVPASILLDEQGRSVLSQDRHCPDLNRGSPVY